MFKTAPGSFTVEFSIVRRGPADPVREKVQCMGSPTIAYICQRRRDTSNSCNKVRFRLSTGTTDETDVESDIRSGQVQIYKSKSHLPVCFHILLACSPYSRTFQFWLLVPYSSRENIANARAKKDEHASFVIAQDPPNQPIKSSRESKNKMPACTPKVS